MKKIRLILFAAFAIMALTVAAEQPDAVVTSIRDAYQQAKASIKKDRIKGNEMVTSMSYTVRGEGKTTETLHFFYITEEGTYWLNEGDTRDPHFNYYPLYFVTRSYNIGKKKYYEEFLFDAKSQRLLFASNQDYDENGKRFERQYYCHNGSVYSAVGPDITPFMKEVIIYQANELRLAFDWLIRNPKE